MFDPSRLPTPDRIDLSHVNRDAELLIRQFRHDGPKTLTRPADQEDDQP